MNWDPTGHTINGAKNPCLDGELRERENER